MRREHDQLGRMLIQITDDGVYRIAFRRDHFSHIDTKIGDRCKLFNNVTILPGVSMGEDNLEHVPVVGERVYVDPAASLIGDVVLGDDVSLWPGVVVRGDVNFIRVGARTNIQDGTVVHVSHDGPHAKLGGFATVIGDDVTIGHKAIVHACRIEDAALIGMGAIVLDGATLIDAGLVGP